MIVNNIITTIMKFKGKVNIVIKLIISEHPCKMIYKILYSRRNENGLPDMDYLLNEVAVSRPPLLYKYPAT